VVNYNSCTVTLSAHTLCIILVQPTMHMEMYFKVSPQYYSVIFMVMLVSDAAISVLFTETSL